LIARQGLVLAIRRVSQACLTAEKIPVITQVSMPLKRWWTRRVLAGAHARIDAALWDRVWRRLPLLAGLDGEESRRLRDLSLLFLRDKTFEQPREIGLDDEKRLTIALQACLPILNLGLEWYRGWYAVILYPDEFVPQREWIDEDGVVWVSEVPMSGEAWEQGPVILSWADVQAGGVRDGFNVVVHELAHKLDMRDGTANGHPPLHRGMSDERWATVFRHAYDDLLRRVDTGEDPALDPYACESPAEFFAVCSEAFFELPHLLAGEYPDVYRQLAGFYRQDPLSRLPPVALDGGPE
jgi:Mlc titration factor MtfA (ptsG expression regulator)